MKLYEKKLYNLIIRILLSGLIFLIAGLCIFFDLAVFEPMKIFLERISSDWFLLFIEVKSVI